MSKVEYKSTSDITAEVIIDGQKVRCSKFDFHHDAMGLPMAEITIINPELHLTTLDSRLIKHDKTLETIKETIKEEMCNHYCKMPEFYLLQYKDPDEAHEIMVNECCAKCPLERLNK